MYLSVASLTEDGGDVDDEEDEIEEVAFPAPNGGGGGWGWHGDSILSRFTAIWIS
jgi:hypothetical protein